MVERKRRAKKHKLKRLLKLSLWMLIIFICIQVVMSHIKTKGQVKKMTTVARIPTLTAPPSPTSTPAGTQSTSGLLAAAVQSTLTGTQGSYGIVVENEKTGELYATNAHVSYESGSLYKLWVMAVVFDQIQQGKLHETDTLSQSVVQLNKAFSIDPDSAEKTSGQITLTVHDALDQMITVSDNYAALLLTQKIQLANLTVFLQKNGFSESKVGLKGQAPITTAADIALFFDKLYKGKLAEQKYTDEMIGLLKRQRLNEKIPEYLPNEVPIAHKTGELDQYTHDAGIIYAPNGDYILSVLSKSDSRDLANERIATVSQAVYDYFTPLH